jgi:hypothetical protein
MFRTLSLEKNTGMIVCRNLRTGSTLRFVDLAPIKGLRVVGLGGLNDHGAARTAACRKKKKAELQAQIGAIKRSFLNEDDSPLSCNDVPFEHCIESRNENTLKEAISLQINQLNHQDNKTCEAVCLGTTMTTNRSTSFIYIQ